MPFSTPPQPSHKEDTTALREMADQLVGKLSALVPHLHSVHEDVTGSIAPTNSPSPPGSASQGSPGDPAPIPSIDTSLTRAYAIVNRLEDDLVSLRSKV